jgi:nitrogen regulatory protein PII
VLIYQYVMNKNILKITLTKLKIYVTLNRKKAIEILESIAEYLGNNKIADENIFDCKNGNTTWYDLEDKVTELLDN